MFEESNLSKRLPTVFLHEWYKVCDMKTYISYPLMCCVLVFDLQEKKFRCFISCVDYEENYEQRAIKCIENGCELPNRVCVAIFKSYFMKEELLSLISKDFKIIIGLLQLMDEK